MVSSHVVENNERQLLPLPSRITYPLYFSCMMMTTETHKVLLKRDYPFRPIDRNLLACSDTLCGTQNADDRGDAIFAGNDRAVRYGSAHFHYQAASGEEERRPAGIGRRGYEDFAGF